MVLRSQGTKKLLKKSKSGKKSSSLECHLRTFFIGDPRGSFVGDPMNVSLETPRFLLERRESGDLQRKYLVSHENMEVSNENRGFSNENLGVSNENLGVFNSTPMMMITSQTKKIVFPCDKRLKSGHCKYSF